MTEAYKEGFKAWKAGEDLSDCPYGYEAIGLRESWRKGWIDADKRISRDFGKLEARLRTVEKERDEALRQLRRMKERYEHWNACDTCVNSLDSGECPQSRLQCGHHCNHSWSHDTCCWCGEEFGGEVGE